MFNIDQTTVTVRFYQTFNQTLNNKTQFIESICYRNCVQHGVDHVYVIELISVI